MCHGVRNEAALSCRAHSWDKPPAEVLQGVLWHIGLGGISTGELLWCTPSFAATPSCRQVKVLSCFAVQLCSMEQVAPAEVPSSSRLKQVLTDICLMCSSKSDAMGSSLTGSATKSLKSMSETDKYFLARVLAGSSKVEGKMDRNGLIDSFNLRCRMSSRKARLERGLDKNSQAMFGGSSYLK